MVNSSSAQLTNISFLSLSFCSRWVLDFVEIGFVVSDLIDRDSECNFIKRDFVVHNYIDLRFVGCKVVDRNYVQCSSVECDS